MAERVLWIALLTGLVFAVGVIAYNAAIALAMRRSMRFFRKGSPVQLENPGADAAVLVLHGFIGSPTDLGRLPTLLHAAGFAVYAPLLPGHGTDPRDFSRTTADELIRFAFEQYDSLAKRFKTVHIVGLSMGGSLATLIAAQRPVPKLALLAPFFKVAHQWYYLLPTELHQQLFMPFIPYVYRPQYFKQINDRSAAQHINDYAFVSLRGAGESLKLGRFAMEAFSKVNCPLLILHSPQDRATDCRATMRLAAGKPTHAVRIETPARSNHALLLDYDHEQVEKSILDFLR